MDLDRLFERYDFKGKTPIVLNRTCGRAARLKGYRKARVLFKCASVLLDWYLTAAFTEDLDAFAGLQRQMGVRCPNHELGRCGSVLLSALLVRFEEARGADPGGRYDWPAQQAGRLVRLQRDEAAKWGREYMSGMFELASQGQPLEVQARLVVAGAVRHVAPLLVGTPWKKRLALLGRTLGFPCPVERIADAKDGGDSTGRGCTLACPEIRPRLVQAPPELRKRLVATHCPLKHLGFTDRAQGVYLTRRGLAAARALVFAARNLQILRSFGRHPLIRPLTGELDKVARIVERIRVVLPYPEMSKGEPGYIRVPYCPVATENTQVPIYVAADRERTMVGVGPVLAMEGTETVVLGDREGYAFPGRSLPGPVSGYLKDAIEGARSVFDRLAGDKAESGDEVGLYADVETTADGLNAVFAALICVGVKKVRLLMRAEAEGVGGLGVRLGPPLLGRRKKRPREGQPPAVILAFDRKRMTLTATDGKLKLEPLKTHVGDLAGLRERLERTRREYLKQNTLTMRFAGQVRYLVVARMLNAVMRNSSGRTLYPSVEFEIPPVPGGCFR